MKLKQFMMCAASLTAGLALVSACGGDDPVEPAKLDVSPATITATADGGVSTITVDANITWTAVSDDADWAEVTDKTDKSFVIDVAPNTDEAERTATVTVSGGDLSKTVTVKQAGKGVNEILLKVTPASADVAAAGGTSSFTIESNGAWAATSNQPWATVSPASGSDNGTITVTSAVSTEAARTATIAVKAGDKTVNVTVKQASGVPPLDLSFFTEVNLPYTKAGKFSDDAVKVELCDHWETKENGVLAYKVTVITASTLTITDKTNPNPANIWWLVWDSPEAVGCDEANALFHNYEGAASALVEPGTYYIAGVSNKAFEGGESVSLDAPYEVEITLESSHIVTSFPYRNVGTAGSQKENLTTCYGPSPGLKYEIHIAEEGDLTIASGEGGVMNYWLTLTDLAATCVWLDEASGFLSETVHLFPGTYVLLCRDAPDSYNYTIDITFTPRVDAGQSDPNGITIAGVLWAKYNTTTDDSGKFVFATTEDGGDALYQWNRQYPASPSNWSTPSDDDYTNRGGDAGPLRKPTYTPCPDGWRLPTNNEFVILYTTGSSWAAKGTKGNGAYAGRFFGTNAASATIADPKGCIFIPAVGYISGNNNTGYATYPGVASVDVEAHVKSSTIQGNDGNYWLIVSENDPSVTESWARPWRAQSARCVKIKD
jgi:uncharacterized protein (TIGR02145 family)